MSAPRCVPARASGTAAASAVGTTGICSPVSRSWKLAASVKLKSISAGSSTMEHDQVVAAEPQRLDGVHDGFGISYEIGHDDEDAAAAEVLGHLLHRHLEVALALRLRAIERVQHAIEVLRRRRDVRHDVVVERDAADAVALLLREIGQARARDTCRIRAWRCRGSRSSSTARCRG